MRHVLTFVGLAIITASVVVYLAQPDKGTKELNIYNWSDYIAEDAIANFEAETGIVVTYDVYDSNEVLEAKMMAGSSGYDLVVPTGEFLARGREAGVYADFDMTRLSNIGNQDQQVQGLATKQMADNKSGIVYMWGTTGIAYNEKMIAERFGESAPVDSWGLILDPVNAAKLADCGIAILDAPTDVLPNVIAYQGGAGDTTDANLFKKAGDALSAIRTHIRYIHSSQSINDMANGDLCVAVMWSGDAFQAAYRAEEAKNGHVIEYYIPSEGTNLWFDLMAIPKDAKNVENAYKFIDYMLRADVAAKNVDYVWYASGNAAARSLIDPEILEHSGIYPSKESQKKFFVLPAYTAELDRAVNSVWSQFISGS
jgi:putrescine transport system substrate-binding protein